MVTNPCSWIVRPNGNQNQKLEEELVENPPMKEQKTNTVKHNNNLLCPNIQTDLHIYVTCNGTYVQQC